MVYIYMYIQVESYTTYMRQYIEHYSIYLL